MMLTLCLFLLPLMQLPTMAKYITDLAVSLTTAEEQRLLLQGFTKVNVDLNKGAGGEYVYLWYKRGNENPITRLQVTFSNDMAQGLRSAGYTKIDKDLNAGAGGDYIYFWYFKGSGEYHTPIVDIDVTTDATGAANMLRLGWEGLSCDLNRKAEGNWIHAWVKRENQTYICDVTATDSHASDTQNLRDGYIRVDEDTNRGAGGSYVFIWYRQTTDPQLALTHLTVSIDDAQAQYLQHHSYQSVNINLNAGAGGNQVYLWHKKQAGSDPIQGVFLLLQCTSADVYKRAGVTVIEKNLNTGNDGSHEYLCVYP